VELHEVLRRRRMVRRFTDEPVAPADRDEILAAALRGPSAGFAQGFAFLALETEEERARLWETNPELVADPDSDGAMRRAPLVIVPLASHQAYIDRYREPDKAVPGQEPTWRVPVWIIDTAFASMLILLRVVDLGLGAVFIAPPTDLPGFRSRFGVPEDYLPIGMILIGHRPPQVDPAAPRARRKAPRSQIFFGRWGTTEQAPA
jgi:nitroreductase